MSHVSFAGRKIRLPNHPVLRMGLGIVLLAGGLLGFLPILGFWMIPLGLIVLSVDVPIARRVKRRASVNIGRFVNSRWPAVAVKLGFSPLRATKLS